MCGIFGSLEPVAPDILARISSALSHRGPDAEGCYGDAGATLLHRRLSIIDLSEGGRQPMGSEDGSVQVVCNGEIYNHHQLRRELSAAGHAFRGRADTEVIVHGYEEWGDNVIRRLDGMFALGVWDARRRRLLLARDRAGKKPLFYSTAGGVFRFASTVAALRAAGLRTAMALDALPYYLAYGFVPPPHTIHTGVAHLAPAERLVVEQGRPPHIDSYWSPRFSDEGFRDRFDEASRRIRELVIRAVERRLEADVPLGAFLSGGIDSTIIVGIMSRVLGRRVRTFSIGFAGDPRYDETAYARIAARAFGTDHTEFTLTPSSFELIEQLVWHHDGPFGDSSAIPTWMVSKLTREHVTVALSGDGGDELFCGYLRFLAAEASEAIPLPLRVLGARAFVLLPGGAGERSLLGRARRFLRASALPLADRMAYWNSFLSDPRLLLRPEIAAQLDRQVQAPLEWQRQVFSEAGGRAVLGRVLEHNFRTYLPFDLLMKADRASMAHALEVRSPFLDTQLIEYASRLPAAYLRRATLTKRILRHAFRDLLPNAIRTRGKMGFGMPLGTWFRTDLRDYLQEHLADRKARITEFLEPRRVRELLEEHDRKAADHSQRIWLLLTLELWLRSLERAIER